MLSDAKLQTVTTRSQFVVARGFILRGIRTDVGSDVHEQTCRQESGNDSVQGTAIVRFGH